MKRYPRRGSVSTLRLVGGIAQCLSELVHRCGEAVVAIDEGISRPKFALDVFPADSLAGISQQQDEQLKGLRLKADLAPFLAQFARTHVELIPVEPDHRGVWR